MIFSNKSLPINRAGFFNTADMKITFIKPLLSNKPGVTTEVTDARGKYLVKVGVAEEGGTVTKKATKKAATSASKTIATKKATPKKSATKKDK